MPFLSNNPARACASYAEKLTRLGLPGEADAVVNRLVYATGWLLRGTPDAVVFPRSGRPPSRVRGRRPRERGPHRDEVVSTGPMPSNRLATACCAPTQAVVSVRGSTACDQQCGTITHQSCEDRGVGRVTLVADAQLELRPVTDAVKPSLIEAVRESHAHLSRWMFWATEEYGPHDAQTFLDSVASGDERAYAVSGREEGGFHGICSLNRVDEINRTANLGYWLRATSTGRGLATRAVRRLLVHALEDLGIERVEIVMSPANIASVRVAERLKLHEEGLRGRAIRVGDQQHDARAFAAFLSDLERLRQAPTAIR